MFFLILRKVVTHAIWPGHRELRFLLQFQVIADITDLHVVSSHVSERDAPTQEAKICL